MVMLAKKQRGNKSTSVSLYVTGFKTIMPHELPLPLTHRTLLNEMKSLLRRATNKSLRSRLNIVAATWYCMFETVLLSLIFIFIIKAWHIRHDDLRVP